MTKNTTVKIPVPDRLQVLGLSCLGACLIIGLLSFVLTPGSRAATLILDRTSPIFPYPFTVQNFEIFVFCIGLGDLFVRWRVARRERQFVAQHLLPEDEQTVLQAHDLAPIRKGVAGKYDEEHGFLPMLIDMCILQFQASRSVGQTVSILNSQLELIAHRVDLRYSLLRYIVWLIPTLGFIGTVVGIAQTLVLMKQNITDLAPLTGTLSTAFDTTIMALAESGILVFFLSMVQAIEERSVNQAGTYCLKNLINRLYTGH